MFVFYWWLIFFLIPALRIGGVGTLGFLQVLIWINVPGQPLASLMGSEHFRISAFGADPQTPWAYAMIALFWTVIAFVAGLATSGVIARLGRRVRNEGEQTDPS
jgi:hypothetical protein